MQKDSPNHVRPYAELARDLARDQAPDFCLIAPNLTNDMHSLAPGSASLRGQGDRWLAREAPGILASRAFTNGGALFILWDEGAGNSDGPTGLILLSPRAKGGGYHNGLYYNHSSMLRTVQDIFGLRPYLGNAAQARNLSDLFQTLAITSARWVNENFELAATNLLPGATYLLQASSSLSSGPWTSLQTNIAVGPSFTFTNAGAASLGVRFFRLVEGP